MVSCTPDGAAWRDTSQHLCAALRRDSPVAVFDVSHLDMPARIDLLSAPVCAAFCLVSNPGNTTGVAAVCDAISYDYRASKRLPSVMLIFAGRAVEFFAERDAYEDVVLNGRAFLASMCTCKECRRDDADIRRTLFRGACGPDASRSHAAGNAPPGRPACTRRRERRADGIGP